METGEARRGWKQERMKTVETVEDGNMRSLERMKTGENVKFGTEIS